MDFISMRVTYVGSKKRKKIPLLLNCSLLNSLLMCLLNSYFVFFSRETK